MTPVQLGQSSSQRSASPFLGALLLVFGLLTAVFVGLFVVTLSLIGMVVGAAGRLVAGLGGGRTTVARETSARPNADPSAGSHAPTIAMGRDADGQWRRSGPDGH